MMIMMMMMMNKYYKIISYNSFLTSSVAAKIIQFVLAAIKFL